MEKITKIEINIDKGWGFDFSGSFRITDCLFSDSDRVIDVGELVARLKRVLRKSEGFDMLTIDVSYGEAYNTQGRQMIASYRFVNKSTGMEMSMALPQTSWHFKEWQSANIKDVYKLAKICVDVANKQHIKAVREHNAVSL